uniref:exodeoxyribonuclease III n=1 Tax=Seriola dumerili TaxID=41447 RepID=A0A3B4VKF1_SERDU
MTMTDLSSSDVGMRSSAVRFTSWNVKGMRGPVKRAKFFAHLKKLKTEIAFLQETHLVTADHMKLRKPWVGQLYHSQFNTKARGTAILICKNVQFSLKESISDPQGRFVIVTGSLFNMQVALACIYAPNWDDASFISRLISALPNMNTHRLIFGGDINCVMDPTLDRSSPKSVFPSKMAHALSTFMNEAGCVDPWRFLFPRNKEFSFFSHVHQSCTRIDYFFIDKTLLPFIKKSECSAIVESDHAPVLLDLGFPLNQAQRPSWRLDSTLLADENFHKRISTAIDNFLLANKSDSVSPSILWETLKVVIRGEIISYTAVSRFYIRAW